MTKERSISLRELKKRLEALPDISTVFIDVREPYEYHERRIEGTVNIPLHDLKNRMSELKNHKTIVTICAHGVRSQKAAKILEEVAPEVVFVKGNIEDWIDEGLPVVTGPGL